MLIFHFRQFLRFTTHVAATTVCTMECTHTQVRFSFNTSVVSFFFFNPLCLSQDVLFGILVSALSTHFLMLSSQVSQHFVWRQLPPP